MDHEVRGESRRSGGHPHYGVCGGRSIRRSDQHRVGEGAREKLPPRPARTEGASTVGLSSRIPSCGRSDLQERGDSRHVAVRDVDGRFPEQPWPLCPSESVPLVLERAGRGSWRRPRDRHGRLPTGRRVSGTSSLAGWPRTLRRRRCQQPMRYHRTRPGQEKVRVPLRYAGGVVAGSSCVTPCWRKSCRSAPTSLPRRSTRVSVRTGCAECAGRRLTRSGVGATLWWRPSEKAC